jgi:hypothetical protein
MAWSRRHRGLGEDNGVGMTASRALGQRHHVLRVDNSLAGPGMVWGRWRRGLGEDDGVVVPGMVQG